MVHARIAMSMRRVRKPRRLLRHLRTSNFPFATARAPRRHGVLDTIRKRRRAAVLAAIAGIGLFTSIPSLPPGAFAVHPAPGAVQSQSLTASAATIAPPGRDTFAISTFSVVQWPAPVSTPVSSGFGFRSCDGCPAVHKGLDVNPGSGYPIRSISAGLVTQAGWDSTGYGNRVIVQHVIDGRTVSSLYAHMRDGSVAVSV